MAERGNRGSANAGGWWMANSKSDEGHDNDGEKC